MVQRALAGGNYVGAIWIEGSPSVEESAYWLSLLIDTHVPISCNAAQRPHGALSNDGDHNLVDSVEYIVSGAWADADGHDRVGAVMCQDGQIFAAREVQKADARPGGYITTGGHGGIVGRIGDAFPVTPTRLMFVPSEVNMRQLPASVCGVLRTGSRTESVPVAIKNPDGELLPHGVESETAVDGVYDEARESANRRRSVVSDRGRIQRNHGPGGAVPDRVRHALARFK